MDSQDSVVFGAIRRAVGSHDSAEAVDASLKKVDPHALAQHFGLPVAISGAPEFDKAVSKRITPCLLMMAQGHLENGRREERYELLKALRYKLDLADWMSDRNQAMMPPIDGATMISVERLRQIYDEGYQAPNDDEHAEGQLLDAALGYLAYVNGTDGCKTFTDDPWPWSVEADKRAEKTPIRRLVIAGALIAAEIDRRLRAGEKP